MASTASVLIRVEMRLRSYLISRRVCVDGSATVDGECVSDNGEGSGF